MPDADLVKDNNGYNVKEIAIPVSGGFKYGINTEFDDGVAETVEFRIYDPTQPEDRLHKMTWELNRQPNQPLPSSLLILPS